MDLPSVLAVLGIIVAVIFGVITVVLSYRALQRKGLAYEDSATPLFQIGTEAKDRIQVLFDGKPVKKVHAVVIRVSNTGNIAIRKNDFEVPLCFRFGDAANVIDVKVQDKKPENLPVILAGSDNPSLSFVEIQSLLLNKKDTFTIKCLVANYDSLKVDGRIAEVSKIERRELLDISAPFRIKLSTLLIIWSLILINIFLLLRIDNVKNINELAVHAIFLTIEVVFLSLFLFLRKKSIIKLR
ncbi:MAG: hypothetical protein HY866_10050 [Chloroflexi bacterium]|nr:hypothetical protein [Chloroflexota bacterium]